MFSELSGAQFANVIIKDKGHSGKECMGIWKQLLAKARPLVTCQSGHSEDRDGGTSPTYTAATSPTTRGGRGKSSCMPAGPQATAVCAMSQPRTDAEGAARTAAAQKAPCDLEALF